MYRHVIATVCVALFGLGAIPGLARAQQPAAPAPAAPGALPIELVGIVPPPDYLIGVDDVLAIVFWKDKDLTVDAAVVRPDGKITLPLINDVHAAGLTPAALNKRIVDLASQYVTGPTVNIIVREIKSRQVSVIGNVGKIGSFSLTKAMTVMEMLAVAGGILEYANKKDIGILRTENGRQMRIRFNYDQVSKGERLEQNIELKPGDTIVVR